MTDERRSDDVRLVKDALGAVFASWCHNEPELDADETLDALAAAGFVVLRVPEGTARHGDELTAIDIGHAYATLGTINGNDYVKYVYGDYVHESYDGPFKPSGHEVPLFAAVRRPVEANRD